MSVVISDDILQAAQISEAELKREIAILLFQQKKLGLSKAQELAGTSLVEFQRELVSRGIPTSPASITDISVNTEASHLQSLSRPLRGLPLQMSDDFDTPKWSRGGTTFHSWLAMRRFSAIPMFRQFHEHRAVLFEVLFQFFDHLPCRGNIPQHLEQFF